MGLTPSLNGFGDPKNIRKHQARSSCNGLISYEQIPDNDLGELNANRKMDRQKARHRTSPCLWVLGHGTCAETAKPKMGPKVLQGNIYWMP
uniref:Uncharacterized protein n=1 Tax=Trichogramma kaykai TaxID=54128 RepID=A0ABD2WHM0_9HYME